VAALHNHFGQVKRVGSVSLLHYTSCIIDATMNEFEQFLEFSKLERHRHQVEGVQWCLEKEQEGTIVTRGSTAVRGGIVADEMGLGKTVQMIGLIATHHREFKRTLVVVPNALVQQWCDMFYRTMKYMPHVYHGPNCHTISVAALAQRRIVVTTYGTMQRSAKERKPLHQVNWDRIIYDEGHHLRNSRTTAYDAAVQLRSRAVWVVTGTPVQNSQADVKNLLQLIGLDRSDLMSHKKLERSLKLLMLRRTKDVLRARLPDLKINTIKVQWHPEDAALAAQLHAQLKFSHLHKSLATDGPFVQLRGQTLALMMRARQICVDASLITGLGEQANPDPGYASAKLQAVVQHLTQQHLNDRKLVFCHFRGEIDKLVGLLRFVAPFLQVQTYDGRMTMTRRAKALTETCNILVMQIQTACEGLNLQQFSRVYFVSPHWNPQVEQQAISRCHRFGQQQDVQVYRFEMAGFPEQVDSRLRRRDRAAYDQVTILDDSDAAMEHELAEDEPALTLPAKRCLTLDQHTTQVQRKKQRIATRLFSKTKQ
jgi:SNF2 family DNA or RNA helicase